MTGVGRVAVCVISSPGVRELGAGCVPRRSILFGSGFGVGLGIGSGIGSGERAERAPSRVTCLS